MCSVRDAVLRSAFGFLSQRFSSPLCDEPASSETNKQNGGQVPTMVLSETRRITGHLKITFAVWALFAGAAGVFGS